MKRYIALFLCVVGLWMAGAAEGAEQFTLSTKALSAYIVDGGLKLGSGPALQTDFFVQLPGGFCFDAWHSFGLDGTGPSSDFADEIDWTLCWSGTVKGFTMNIGISYYDLVGLFTMPRGDVIRPYAEVGWPIKLSKSQTITPFLRLEAMIPAHGAAPENGGSIRGGFNHWMRLQPWLEASQRVTFIYDDGALGLKPAGLGKYEAGLHWRLYERIKLELPAIKAAGPLTRVPEDRKWRLAIGVGASFMF